MQEHKMVLVLPSRIFTFSGSNFEASLASSHQCLIERIGYIPTLSVSNSREVCFAGLVDLKIRFYSFQYSHVLTPLMFAFFWTIYAEKAYLTYFSDEMVGKPTCTVIGELKEARAIVESRYENTRLDWRSIEKGQVWTWRMIPSLKPTVKLQPDGLILKLR